MCKLPIMTTKLPKIAKQNNLNQAPCGTNAKCEGSGSRAVCKCLEGYEGDPFVRYVYKLQSISPIF